MSGQRAGLLKQCSCDAARWPKCVHPWHVVGRFDGRRYSISVAHAHAESTKGTLRKFQFASDGLRLMKSGCRQVIHPWRTGWK